jgi:hypothetical protein
MFIQTNLPFPVKVVRSNPETSYILFPKEYNSRISRLKLMAATPPSSIRSIELKTYNQPGRNSALVLLRKQEYDWLIRNDASHTKFTILGAQV